MAEEKNGQKGKSETMIYVEDEESGLTVRIPESKLESWKAAQEAAKKGAKLVPEEVIERAMERFRNL